MYGEISGQGKEIVYLHGWGASGRIFSPVVNLLPNYRNVTVDFAGFGSSPFPPSNGFTVFDYARQTAEYLRAQDVSNATVVAHSFGCRIAMILAVDYPELIGRLLLFAPAGLRRFSLKRWCKVRIYKLTKRFRRTNCKRCGSADYNATPNELKSTFVKVVNQDLSSYARKIRCKTLIVAATEDNAVPFSSAKRLNKLIKNSNFCAVRGDHFQLFYTPQSFAEIVRLFAEE